MNFPLVAKILGVVMLTLGLAFIACLSISYLFDGPSAAALTRTAFIAAAGIAFAAAGLFFWVGRSHSKKFFRKEALCTIGIAWLLASFIGTIPYLMVVPEAGFSGAFFESASGLTTTGASVLTDLEQLPPSLLFWRSLSQWIGGLGVVVFFVAVLGFIGVGAKMLYANEASGSVSEFEESRIQSTVGRLVCVYLGLSSACCLSYRIAGMSWFDAVNHTFTTVSTAGFSTRTASIGAYGNPAIEWVSIVFMTLAGLNFLLILRLFLGRLRFLQRSTEFAVYLCLMGGACVLVSATLILDGTITGFHDSIRAGVFQVVSIMTTTGFATENFAAWGSLPQMVLLVLMIIGGCSGSTAGGIKISRLVIALRLSFVSIERSFRTRVVRQIRLNGNVLSPQAVSENAHYLVLLTAIVAASILLVSIFEPSHLIDTNLSVVFACFFNIGPGIAEVGPTQDFGFLHPHTKVFLGLLMIMGRLELYAILALLSPSLWKRFA